MEVERATLAFYHIYITFSLNYEKVYKGFFFIAIGGVISHFLKRFPEDCVSDSENRSVVSESL